MRLILDRRNMIVIAASGSLALLLGAYFFEALGYAPCQMCLWQRWPHFAALALAPLALKIPKIAFAGGLAALCTAALGGFHTGVEQGWWDGPSACSGSGADLGLMSGADLLSTDIAEVIVRCDEVAWMFLGLSMATWNMIASLCLAALWFKSLKVSRS